MKVVGEVDVLDILVNSPDVVWNETSKYAGITKRFFDKYYNRRDKAVAYHLGNVRKFKIPKNLSDYGLKSAPQSFVYI